MFHLSANFSLITREDTDDPTIASAMCNTLFARLYGLLGYDNGTWDDRPTGLSYDDSWRLPSD
jgi:hypothetical protein